MCNSNSVGVSSRGQQTLDSYCQLCHSPLESREVANTMPRPLVVPVASGDPLSADGAPASPLPVHRPEPQQFEPTV